MIKSFYYIKHSSASKLKKHFDGTFFERSKLKEIKNLLENFNYTLKELDKENILATKTYL